MSRRLPLEPDGRRQRTDPSFQPGSTRGRIGNASPVGDGGGRGRVRPTSPGNSGPGGGAQFFDQEWTLAAAGAQSKALTYLPLPYSEHVIIGGLLQRRAVDFTIAGQTLNVLAGMDSRVGDVLAIEYAYTGAVPISPADGVLVLNVPFASPGWTFVSPSVGVMTGWESSLTFNDAAWSTAAMPIGTAAFVDPHPHSVPAGSVASGSDGGLGVVMDAFVRRVMPAGTSIVVGFAQTNYFEMYADGVLIASAATGNPTSGSANVGTKTGQWLLAAHVRVGNGLGNGGIDLEVTGVQS